MKRKFKMGGVVIQQLLQKKGGQDLFNCSPNTSERGCMCLVSTSLGVCDA